MLESYLDFIRDKYDIQFDKDATIYLKLWLLPKIFAEVSTTFGTQQQALSDAETV